MGHGMASSRKTDRFLWIIVGTIHIYIYTYLYKSGCFLKPGIILGKITYIDIIYKWFFPNMDEIDLEISIDLIDSLASLSPTETSRWHPAVNWNPWVIKQFHGSHGKHGDVPWIFHSSNLWIPGFDIFYTIEVILVLQQGKIGAALWFWFWSLKADGWCKTPSSR